MIKDTTTNNDADEPEEINDEDATLADDLLDEVSGDVADTDDDTVEGFGIMPEPKEDEEEDDKDEKDDEETHDLEEDAEDVDFDIFDDIDEM